MQPRARRNPLDERPGLFDMLCGLRYETSLNYPANNAKRRLRLGLAITPWQCQQAQNLLLAQGENVGAEPRQGERIIVLLLDNALSIPPHQALAAVYVDFDAEQQSVNIAAHAYQRHFDAEAFMPELQEFISRTTQTLWNIRLDWALNDTQAA